MNLKIMVGALLVLCGALVAASADYQTDSEAFERGDYATALKEWLPLAEQGNAEAQFQVGRMFSSANMYGKGFKWFRNAAKQGHPTAAGALGLLGLPAF